MASGPPPPSVSRRLGLLELLLVPLMVLLISGFAPALGQKVYTNTWAVHIPGGQDEADRIASKYGFINYGHVSKAAFCSCVMFRNNEKALGWKTRRHRLEVMQIKPSLL